MAYRKNPLKLLNYTYSNLLNRQLLTMSSPDHPREWKKLTLSSCTRLICQDGRERTLK